MSKPKKTKATKVVKPLNAKELKAWLRGIQEFQLPTWTPTAEQWKTIVDKIFALEEHSDYDYSQVETSPTYEPPRMMQYEHAPSPLGSVGNEAPSPRNEGYVATLQPSTESGIISIASPSDGPYRSGLI